MKIIEAKALPRFQLSLRFDDGQTGSVDLSSFAGRGVFSVWNEPGIFEQVAVTDQGAVVWPGEIDLCPDALYLQMTGKQPHDLFPELQRSPSHA